MKTLFLEKRGCDFWQDSIERARVKDFDNYRYCGYISKAKKIFLELTINTRKKSKYSKFTITTAHLDFSFEDKKGYCWRDLKKCGYCLPTEKDVLNYINNVYKRHFKEIKIVEDIEK